MGTVVVGKQTRPQGIYGNKFFNVTFFVGFIQNS